MEVDDGVIRWMARWTTVYDGVRRWMAKVGARWTKVDEVDRMVDDVSVRNSGVRVRATSLHRVGCNFPAKL